MIFNEIQIGKFMLSVYIINRPNFLKKFNCKFFFLLFREFLFLFRKENKKKNFIKNPKYYHDIFIKPFLILWKKEKKTFQVKKKVEFFFLFDNLTQSYRIKKNW